MRVEKGKQSNHTSFVVPPELGDTVCRSLRDYVARWLLLHRRFACCDQVADAFGISRRQASNIIYSIHSRHSDVYVCTIKRIKEGKGNVVKTWLRIDEILPVKRKKSSSLQRLDSVNENAHEIQNLISLFLRGSLGGTVKIKSFSI